jgi:hypothetical protein
MAIYDRAARSVALERRAEVYSLYIAKAAESFGVTKTRDIYELAISELPSSELAPMCLRYANLERKLGEIDRARAIYMHGAHEVDPSKAAGSANGGDSRLTCPAPLCATLSGPSDCAAMKTLSIIQPPPRLTCEFYRPRLTCEFCRGFRRRHDPHAP